jgi:hypothetical protein
MAMNRDHPREALERRKLRISLLTLMWVPPLFGVLGLFSPQPWAPWVAAAAIAPPLVVTPLLALSLRRPGSYRPSSGWAMFITLIGATLLACLAVPVAYLLPWSAKGVAVMTPMLLGLALGLFAGRHRRMDAAAHSRALRRRFRPQPGRLIIDSGQRAGIGLRPSRPGDMVDRAIDLAMLAYAALVLVGALTGGAAGLIVLALVTPQIPTDAVLGPHATAMIALGTLAMPVLGYMLPAFWQGRRLLRGIEAEAIGSDGSLTCDWQDPPS